MRSALRSWFVSPEAAGACSISCLILSRRIAIRSLSSDSDNELSLLMVHPLGDCVGWAERPPELEERRHKRAHHLVFAIIGGHGAKGAPCPPYTFTSRAPVSRRSSRPPPRPC